MMAIKQAIACNGFFNDINMPEEAKQQDKLYKVRPLLDN